MLIRIPNYRVFGDSSFVSVKPCIHVYIVAVLYRETLKIIICTTVHSYTTVNGYIISTLHNVHAPVCIETVHIITKWLRLWLGSLHNCKSFKLYDAIILDRHIKRLIQCGR